MRSEKPRPAYGRNAPNCFGKANSCRLYRRESLMSTMRVDPVLVGSNTPPWVSKNDCSTDTYMAIFVRVISHSPPNVGAEMSSAAAPNIETPPFAPQYHESVKERA